MTFGEHIDHNWGAHVHDDDDHLDEEYAMVPHYRRDKPGSAPQVPEAQSSGDSAQSERAKNREDFLMLLRSLRNRPQRNGRHSVDDAAFDVYINKRYAKRHIVTGELNAEGRRMLGGKEAA